MTVMPRDLLAVVADDQPAVLEALTEFLKARSWRVVPCADGGEALSAIRSRTPDLVIVDASMPVLSGIDVIRHLRFVCGKPRIPALIITGRSDPRILREAARAGAHEVLTKPFRLSHLNEIIVSLTQGPPRLPRNLDLGYDSTACLELLLGAGDRHAQPRLEALGRAISLLARAVDHHDPHGSFHSLQVAELASLTAASLGLSRKELPELRLAGLAHDVGKLLLPGPILSGTETPSERDWEVIRSHPEQGHELLQPLVQGAAEAVLHHHERWDGGGYPKGLAGESIPQGARILSVVESYAAMTSRTRYGEPLGPQEALEVLRREAGSQFDPSVVQAFGRLVEEPAPCSVS